ncbi:uncharacterized protein LOC111103749 [Crassostrea virginica]
MGPLVKVWSAIDGARKGQEENNEFSIMDMLKLVEQVVVLVGQANATCLYERRLNFLAKIMKGVKKAKEQLKTYEHDLAQETDTLYGDTIYRALDRRCKSKKRAREISREMQPKRRRLEQPFRKAPSRGYTYSQGRRDNKCCVVVYISKARCALWSSDSDPYESCQDSARPESSDDENARGALSDDGDSLSIHANESDSERFDPTEGESTFMLEGGMASYCRKYFYKHLTDESIKRNILDDAPVPTNAFCNPPKVDEFVEDFIDYNSMKFLKLHDKSLAFIQKKITQIMGPLVKVWSAIDGARKGQEENNEFSIMDMLKLVEQVVVLVGQANATCLYERRLNFLAKIMKGVKKAKEQLKTYEHDLAQETDTLYGDTIYRALDRRCKSKKRAREISREMQPKRRRLEQPFREAPSRGYTYSQGRGGGVSTYKQTKQGPKRGAGGSGFRIPKKSPRKTELEIPVCEEEITWWIHQLDQWNGKQIRMSVNPDLTIKTDASKTGWGAVCPALSVTMGGPWSVSEKQLHINALEMKAVQFAVQAMTKENLLISSEGQMQPLIRTNTLKLVAWKVSGELKKQQEFRSKLPNCWQQDGGKGLRQLITAAGDSGVAGVTQGKLIHFTPLWKI